MRRATLEEMSAAPVGRYTAGDGWAHFCAAPELWGVLLWGRPDEQQALALGRSLVIELGPRAVPHGSLVDASRLEGGDPRAFEAAELYLTRYHAALAARVTKLALVRPSGMGGAIVAGAYDVLPKPYPVEVFSDVAAAIAWLDPAREDRAGAIAAIHAELTGTTHQVASLRALLDGALDGLPIANAAKRLGLSARTLQRKLAEAGTTYKDEVADARVRAAKRLLAETDEPLTAIALDVGCASLQSFSALFRRRTGETPSAFRARTRPPHRA